MKHSIVIDGRNKTTISGVKQVLCLTEREAEVSLEEGTLSVKGEGLHANQLNVAEGVLVVDGTVQSISYGQAKGKGLAKWLK